MALQPPNGNRLVLRPQDARPLAQFLYRANARAGCTQQIRLQNRTCRAPQVVRADLLDEPGYIDVGRTRVRARSVVAHQAARRLHQGLVPRQRRQKFAECVRLAPVLQCLPQLALLINAKESAPETAKPTSQA